MTHPDMVYVGEIEAASDGSMASALRKEGSASQQAVDERITPAAVAAVAERPEVVASAAALAQSDEGLARRSDPGYPTEIAPDPGYTKRVVSENGVDYGGYRTDGSTHMTKGSADTMTTAGLLTTSVADGSAVTVPIDVSGRMLEPGHDETGRTAQRHIDSWGQRINHLRTTEVADGGSTRRQIDASGRILEPGADESGRTDQRHISSWAPRLRSSLPRTIAFWTDSMSADFGNLGSSVAARVESNLSARGVSVAKLGVIGQRMNEIGIRKGIPLYLSAAGNQLPASGSVAVTIVTPGPWHPTQPWSFTGTVPGLDGARYAVTLSKPNTNTQAWTLTRTTAGAVVPLAREVRFESLQADQYGEWGQIIWGGRNLPDQAADVAALKLMLRTQGAMQPRRLVLPVFNTSAEPLGSPAYLAISAQNAAYADAAGADYYDARGWMIRNGLAAAGITPTTQDTADLANDVIPASLRYDATHLNTVGRNALADQLTYVVDVERKWFA